MKTFTLEQLKAFVNSQPPERTVDMNQSNSTDSCGCLLVQFAKESLKIQEVFDAGFYRVGENILKFSDRLKYEQFFNPLLDGEIFTYREIAEGINKI